ncbi:HTH-type transcriptional regulator CdhR [Thalassocella blandensis]|nr:HTH-type transcriptional regulator CdhR [Thalassocella blandensis]
MDEIALFNLNDVIVFMGAFLSLSLALMLFFKAENGRIARKYWNLLAMFFLLSTLHSIDTLVYWSISLNEVLSKVSTNIFFLFGFIFFLQGPLLYWYTKAAIYRDFTLKKYDALHLIPALIYPVYMYFIYYRYDHAYKLQFVQDWSSVTSNYYFEALIWSQRLFVFAYSVLSLMLLLNYIRHIKTQQFLLSKIDLRWLKILLIGFLSVNTWVVFTLFESRFTDFGFDSMMGAMESKLRFIYMAVLVIHLLKHSHGFADIQVEHTISASVSPEQPHQQLLEKLKTYMEEKKPYLEPNITVERLAIRLEVSPKLLSSTINSQLNKNFFEMIGSYRLEEAKKRLSSVEFKDESIGDIMKGCGFNSKSVFNQAFKKNVGVTPSHYRQQHIQ